MFVYIVNTSLRFPTAEARKVNFKELVEDLENAIILHNSTNPHKKIDCLQAYQQMFSFRVVFNNRNEPPKSVGHELSHFARILYTQFGWSKFSRLPNKLFQYQSEQANTVESSNIQAHLSIDEVSKRILVSKSLIEDGYQIYFF